MFQVKNYNYFYQKKIFSCHFLFIKLDNKKIIIFCLRLDYTNDNKTDLKTFTFLFVEEME